MPSTNDASMNQPGKDATLRKVVQEEVAKALGRGSVPPGATAMPAGVPVPRQGLPVPTVAKTPTFQQPPFPPPGSAMTPNVRERSGDGWRLGQGDAMNSVAKSAAKAMQHVGKIVPTVSQAVA